MPLKAWIQFKIDIVWKHAIVKYGENRKASSGAAYPQSVSQLFCKVKSHVVAAHSFIIIHDSWQFIKLFHKITIKITMKAALFDNIRVFMMVAKLKSIYGKLRYRFTFRAFLLSAYPATCFHSSYYHFVLAQTFFSFLLVCHVISSTANCAHAKNDPGTVYNNSKLSRGQFTLQ